MAAEGSFTIDIVRGGVVESRHRIQAVVADRHRAVEWWGDRHRPTIPRSAIKSIQALPLVLTGALDAFAVSPRELALACASHSGEEAHVEAVVAWLRRLGLSEEDLECGDDRPLGREAQRRWVASGAPERAVLNGCSGKHAGFLTVARHLDVPAAGYVARHHPVQRRVTAAIAVLADLDLDAATTPTGIDGCGIPVFALPLWRLAFAMARLVDPVDLADDHARATGPVVEAAQLAFWVSGTGRTEVTVVDAATEPVVIKTGAEGVFMAALPRRGLGIALKAEDGASRASQQAILALLRKLEVLPAGPDGVDRWMSAPVVAKDGTEVGELRAVLDRPRRS